MKNSLSYVLVFLLIGCMFFSCEKEFVSDQNIISNFFKTDYVTKNNPNIQRDDLRKSNEIHPTISEFKKYLQALNLKEDDIELLTKTYGYPMWDRSFSILTKDTTQVFIPMAFTNSNESKLSSMLIGTKLDGEINWSFGFGNLNKLIQASRNESNINNLRILTFVAHANQTNFKQIPCEIVSAINEIYFKQFKRDNIKSPELRGCYIAEYVYQYCQWTEWYSFYPVFTVHAQSQCFTVVDYQTICEPDAYWANPPSGANTGGGWPSNSSSSSESGDFTYIDYGSETSASPSDFQYKKGVGNAWYACVKFSLKFADSRTGKFISINTDYQCIQVPHERWNNDIVTLDEAQTWTNYAFQDAFEVVGRRLGDGYIATSAALRTEFLKEFKTQLTFQFGGGTSVNGGGCNITGISVPCTEI